MFSGGPDTVSSPVSLGSDSRAKIVPRMRRVREPVKHEHERPRTLLEIGEFQPVRVDELDRTSHDLRTLRQTCRRWDVRFRGVELGDGENRQ